VKVQERPSTQGETDTSPDRPRYIGRLLSGRIRYHACSFPSKEYTRIEPLLASLGISVAATVCMAMLVALLPIGLLATLQQSRSAESTKLSSHVRLVLDAFRSSTPKETEHSTNQSLSVEGSEARPWLTTAFL
jgi:hypothetical protein